MAKLPCPMVAFPVLLFLVPAANAQAGSVDHARVIRPMEAGFGGPLHALDSFGRGVARLGDLDGDGVVDLAVGAQGDDDGGMNAGAVWILFLNTDGTVKAEQKISETAGGLGVDLQPFDYFGKAVAGLGDLDGDGIGDLAVGAFYHSQLWILFLHADGTVKAKQRIAAGTGGFGGDIVPQDFFGTALACIGDLDGDGVADLAVGAEGDDDGAPFQGAVWILFLNTDGTVKAEQKISATHGGFGGDLDELDLFGTSVAPLADLDGDGALEIAVGARGDDDLISGRGGARGAVWILFLRTDGTVRAEQKISETAGGFDGNLDRDDYFGSAVASLGDLDGDGKTDLAVSAVQDDDGGSSSDNWGAVWILFLDRDGRVKTERKISSTSGGFGAYLTAPALFGSSLVPLGDLDGDGTIDLAVGASGDFTQSLGQGALWILFLEGAPPCLTFGFETEDDLVTPLVNGQHIDTEFGALMTLASSGPNAGLGLFDSTPGGPNDPSQDPDLLVGSGNLLILQTENFPPDGNDVFPRPNDDEDGGVITFDFALPVEPRHLRLVDVDAADGPARIVLEDASAHRRTYTIPGDWTGDRTLGQPGRGTLDLGTLTPQPGFASTATVAEDPGFEPTDVVRLEVQLDGSAGLDDLELCSESLPRASVRVRNGSDINPSNLATRTLPVLGGTWIADLDCSAFDPGLALLTVRSRACARRTPAGEILTDGAIQFLALRPHAGAASQFGWSLPRDLSLCGLELHAQGLCRVHVPTASSGKTARARERLSNALDLVLGF